MRALIQRASQARVEVNNETVGEIQEGLLVLLGITSSDSQKEAEFLAQKISKLRIFNDAEGKMNLSVQDIQGSILVVSQFTLYAEAKKGNRPSYIHAARPEQAIPLYEYFVQQLELLGIEVETGKFGANMDVHLLNQGPVTIWLDSEHL